MIGQKHTVETGRESGLEAYGSHNIDAAHWNLGASALVELAVQRREGHLSAAGAFVVRTGQYTGRSPKDKFLVRDELTEKNVQWGAVNQPITEEQFNRIYSKMQSFWQGHEVELRFGKGLVHRAPLYVLFGQLVAHQELVLGRTPGVLPGTHHQCAIGGEVALPPLHGMLDQRRGSQIPVGSVDIANAVGFQPRLSAGLYLLLPDQLFPLNTFFF